MDPEKNSAFLIRMFWDAIQMVIIVAMSVMVVIMLDMAMKIFR